MNRSTLFLRDDLAQAWAGKDIYTLLSELQGDVFRDKEGRKTMRFELNNRSYFLKFHQGVGWTEICKNWLSLRKPIVSARNEWQAVQFLESHGIETMTLAGYGERGLNPATRHSFVITDELIETMSLEHLGTQWRKQAPSFSCKKNLIEKLARIASVMHKNGMNHRDFYLCHFLLDKRFAEHNQFEVNTPVYLIDLHRAQIRKKTPERWLIKDLGSLYFSAYDVALTQRDLLRFIKVYSGISLREALVQHKNLWLEVKHRADKLFDE